MSRQYPEAALQRAVAQFLRRALRPPTFWTAIGHGGGGRVRGAQLKAMGVQKGWPDIIVMHPHAVRGTLVVGIELKAGKNKQSDDQCLVEKWWGDCRAHYLVARSIEEVEGFLRGVGVPIHASVSASFKKAAA